MQQSFELLKKALLSSPLLRLPDYTKYFILYLATSESTIGVVLVQEDDKLQEHVIYYLIHALVGPNIRYSHVEKLDLEVVYVVQMLRHYILQRKTTIVVDVIHFSVYYLDE